ncbi:PLC-like phosphodiesterase [Nemania sp. FL0031]|nr:PLC-like phosphodiesterase [Nemania sp. FL0031]
MGEGTYLTLVNGTPYRWKRIADGHTKMEQYHYPETVEPFSNGNHYLEFEGLFFNIAAEAWAEYLIEGTSSRFVVSLNRKSRYNKFSLILTNMSTLSDPQGAEFELGFVLNKHAQKYHYFGTTVIVAGVDGAFVTTSPNNIGPWMSRSLSYLGERTLRQICMPGSHNSGVTKNLTHIATTTPKSLVVCQYGSVWDQLRLGVRYFDIRPTHFKERDFTTGHYSIWNGIQTGGSGQFISDIVNNVNDFLKGNPELVVLNLSHDYDWDDGLKGLTPAMWDQLLTQLDRLNYRFMAERGADLSKLKLNDFIGKKEPAVIVICELDTNSRAYLGDREGKGYFYRHSLPVFDQYANKMEPQDIVDDQLKKLREQRPDLNNNMFVLAWAQTPAGLGDVFEDLPLLGNLAMAPRLGADVLPVTTNKMYPNVLSLDGVKTTMAVAAATAINAKAQP